MEINLIDTTKTYRSKKMPPVEALKGVSFELPSAGLVFILGKSGCGKTTLLNILGGLDDFDGGDVTVWYTSILHTLKICKATAVRSIAYTKITKVNCRAWNTAVSLSI